MLLSAAKIESILLFEPLLVIAGLCLMSYFVYKLLLRGVSSDRHRLLQGSLKNLLIHFVVLSVLFGVSRLAGSFGEGESTLAEIIESRLFPYMGFVT